MSPIHRPGIALTTLIIGLMAASTAGAVEPPLFSDHVVPATAMRQADRLVGSLAAAPSTRQLQVVTAAVAQVDTGTQRLYLNLAPGAPLLVDQMSAYRNDDGTVVWNGLVGGTAAAAARMQRHGATESVEDPLNTATIVRNGSNLTGSVRVAGRLYRIEPIGQGRHAVIEIDEAALPPDDGPDPLPVGKASLSAMSSDVDAKSGTPTEARVMVVFTRHAADSMTDPRGFAQSMVAEANRGYSGSSVDVRLRLAGIRISNYREYAYSQGGVDAVDSFVKDLARFRGRSDGHMDEAHAARNRADADLMVLVRRDGKTCGIASQILADAATAFAVMSRSCGPGRYTFHHEIGHLQGARHNMAEDNNTYPFGHGHGFVSRSGGFSTVMAYPPGDGSAPRVMWFSNPRLYLNDVRMGTTSREDNARVLNQTRFRIAGFR